MKYLVPIILISLCSMSAWGQTIERSVISSYGASGHSGGIQIDMTVGEVATSTSQSGTFVLTQGFHQPGDGVTSIDHPLQIVVTFKLYPNPTTSLITLELSSAEPAQLHPEIVDMRGRLVLSGSDMALMPGQNHSQSWDIGMLAEGEYVVTIKDQNGAFVQNLRFRKQ